MIGHPAIRVVQRSVGKLGCGWHPSGSKLAYAEKPARQSSGGLGHLTTVKPAL